MNTVLLAQEVSRSEPAVSGFAAFAVDIMERLGAPGAGLAIALENLFPPLPSEVILPLAGFTASRGDMGLVSAIIWTTIGSVVGALALYYVGLVFGYRRTMALAAKLPLVKTTDIEKTDAWFERHGNKAIFFGRMIPIFRSLISIPAGIKKMPLGRFLSLTALGSLIWNTAFILAGYSLGENWDVVEGYVGTATKAVLAAGVVAVLIFAISRIVRGSRTA